MTDERTPGQAAALTKESLVCEIRERVQSLESNLLKSLDAMAVSRITKVPWKALLLREAFSWRMADLARGPFENLEKDRLASAIVLTRAAVETCAALWYLCGKVSDAIDAKTVGDIDEYVMKLMMGSRTDPAMPQALNVLGFVDHVDKEVEGFRHQYDLLSEFAHPNHDGTSLLFLEHNVETRVTEFGTTIRTESAKKIGVLNLSVALMIFESSQRRLANLIPAFTALCESQLANAQDSPSCD